MGLSKLHSLALCAVDDPQRLQMECSTQCLGPGRMFHNLQTSDTKYKELRMMAKRTKRTEDQTQVNESTAGYSMRGPKVFSKHRIAPLVSGECWLQTCLFVNDQVASRHIHLFDHNLLKVLYRVMDIGSFVPLPSHAIRFLRLQTGMQKSLVGKEVKLLLFQIIFDHLECFHSIGEI